MVCKAQLDLGICEQGLAHNSGLWDPVRDTLWRRASNGCAGTSPLAPPLMLTPPLSGPDLASKEPHGPDPT